MARKRERRIVAINLPWGGGPMVFVEYPAIQGCCSSCGRYKTVRPEEIHPTRKATWRLMRYVSQLARYVPLDAMPSLIEVPADCMAL